MHFNKLTQTSVGADLSARAGFHDILVYYLKFIIEC